MGKTAADTQPHGKSHERFGCGLAENQVKIDPRNGIFGGEFGSPNRFSVAGYLPVTCTVARSEIWFMSRLAVWVLENQVKLNI